METKTSSLKYKIIIKKDKKTQTWSVDTTFYKFPEHLRGVENNGKGFTKNDPAAGSFSYQDTSIPYNIRLPGRGDKPSLPNITSHHTGTKQEAKEAAELTKKVIQEWIQKHMS